MIKVCDTCGLEYDTKSKDKNTKGKYTQCAECGEEGETAVKYTGIMVYDHKTSAQCQINSNPLLTEYLINATKLKNKGSNMTNNVANCTKYKNLNKTEGSCVHTADAFNYKNRDGI
jgi:DNA-directed RNA polymerase subunit RPC12/RpoP